MYAAHFGKLEVVKLLCEMKADVECKDAVRMMCVLDMLDVLNIESQCSYVLYVCCEWFDGIHINV